jgi:hypothetical protein
MRGTHFLLCTLIGAAFFGVPSARAQDAPSYKIFPVAGDVYQFRANGHYGVFVPTSEGIILVDPISAAAGDWLKAQLAERFPDRPVRTIIYSHHDGDHSGGAEAFADTVAEIVAQQNAPRGIAADDRVHVMPTRTFSGKTTDALGGKTLELIELGPRHTHNLTACASRKKTCCLSSISRLDELRVLDVPVRREYEPVSRTDRRRVACFRSTTIAWASIVPLRQEVYADVR